MTVHTFYKPPIIIGGCGRSGTSLLLSIVSAHPNIWGIPHETRFFCPTAYTENFNIDASIAIEPLYQHLSNCEIPSNCQRWCEKTPKNIVFFGKILQYFKENVRLIHIVRDGRDVVTSIHPEKPNDFWVSPERWINDVNAGLKYIHHSQVITIRYEDLIMDFRLTIEKLCDFIDEKPDEQIFTRYKQAEKDKFEKTTTLYTSSIQRWKQPQYAERVKQFMDTPGTIDLLKYFNYNI